MVCHIPETIAPPGASLHPNNRNLTLIEVTGIDEGACLRYPGATKAHAEQDSPRD